MDQHPIQGGVEIFLVASCCIDWDKLRPDDSLGLYAELTFPSSHAPQQLVRCCQIQLCEQPSWRIFLQKYGKRKEKLPLDYLMSRYTSISYHFLLFLCRPIELAWSRWPWVEHFTSVVQLFSSQMDVYLLRMRSGICFALLGRGVISMLCTHICIQKNISLANLEKSQIALRLISQQCHSWVFFFRLLLPL